MFQISESEGRN
jgi:hypothetical protein